METLLTLSIYLFAFRCLSVSVICQSEPIAEAIHKAAGPTEREVLNFK